MTAAFKQVCIESEGSDIFVVADGIRIAKLGHAGTPHARTWISTLCAIAPTASRLKLNTNARAFTEFGQLDPMLT